MSNLDNNTQSKELQSALVELFLEKLNLKVSSEDTDLFETGLLDSQTFVELLFHIEQRFDAQVIVEDFELANFCSITRIAELILKHRASSTCTVESVVEPA